MLANFSTPHPSPTVTPSPPNKGEGFFKISCFSRSPSLRQYSQGDVKVNFFYKSTVPSEQTTSVAGTLPRQPVTKVIAFHCSTVPPKIIVVSDVQLKKASLPIKLKVLGKLMLSSEVQL